MAEERLFSSLFSFVNLATIEHLCWVPQCAVIVETVSQDEPCLL